MSSCTTDYALTVARILQGEQLALVSHEDWPEPWRQIAVEAWWSKVSSGNAMLPGWPIGKGRIQANLVRAWTSTGLLLALPSTFDPFQQHLGCLNDRKGSLPF